MLNSLYQIAEIKLSYKNKPDLPDLPKIAQSKDAYTVLLDCWDDEQIGFVEQAKVLLLNQANCVLGIYEFSTGGVTGTICDPKLVFAAALKTNACNLILAHNHPSESLAPSRADKTLTEKVKQAGEYLDITLLDHLIISPHGYYSFTDDATYNKEDLDLDDPKKKPAKAKKKKALATEIIAPTAPMPTLYKEPSHQDFAGRKIAGSQTAYDALMGAWDANTLDIERSYKLLCLDKDCTTTSLHSFPQEMTLATDNDAHFIISLASRDKAGLIVLAQNKPYGVILPNMTDFDFTAMLTKAGKDHDIPLLDYLFVNQDGYYSYNDNEFHLRNRLQPR